MFAIGWMELGNQSAAATFFQQGYAQNIVAPFFVWREFISASGGGCTPFLTGAGGFLQSLLNGIGGIRLERDALALTPSPPSIIGSSVTRIAFESLNWRGATLRVEMDYKRIRISQLTAGQQPISVRDNKGEVHSLEAGGEIVDLPTEGTLRLISG